MEIRLQRLATTLLAISFSASWLSAAGEEPQKTVTVRTGNQIEWSQARSVEYHLDGSSSLVITRRSEDSSDANLCFLRDGATVQCRTLTLSPLDHVSVEYNDSDLQDLGILGVRTLNRKGKETLMVVLACGKVAATEDELYSAMDECVD